ncbi:PAS domain S-box protein [Echinicola soli]|uniref:histidine kinase n=1 Tax=Echinicola soli TaxID=2591634 RepID=A0A514CCL4_9BACT|nr:ATP-binding protein [Echinicola soli]QDH77520.1 PAS domain S-box protein [Echinicola soli]
MPRIIIFLYFLFFLKATLMAQSFQMNKQIKGLDLPSQIVSSINQDKAGRIWFATAKGVFYSDGINTYSLPEELTRSMEGTAAFEIDEQGEVWVYVKKGKPQVFKLVGHEWERYGIADAVSALFDGEKMDFYVSGTKAGKLLVLSGNGVLASTFENSKEWTGHHYNEEQWGRLRSIFCSSSDNILFLFGNKAVRFIEGRIVPFEFHESSLPGPVWMVRYSQAADRYFFLGNDFLASGQSLYEIDTIIDRGFSQIDYFYDRQYGLQIKDRGVYYFFNSQLYKYNLANGQIIEISTYDVLKSFYINASFVDRENIIWIGTGRGVVNLPTLRFQNYNKWEGLLEHEVSAVLTMEEGGTLYGFNNGMQHWKDGKVVFESKEEGLMGEPKNRITTFHRDKNGIVWISSAMKGVGRYDPYNHLLTYVQAPDKSFVMHVIPKGDSLYIVAKKHVYLSNIYHRGMTHFKNEITQHLFDDLLGTPVDDIRKVDFTDTGKMIVMAGDWKGLKDSVLSNDEVMAFSGYDWMRRGKGFLLATHDGLKYYDGDKLVPYLVNGQMVERPVYSVLEDKKGNLWAGTDEGVAIIGNGMIRYFNEHSGLVGNEVNRGALTVDGQGRVHIGTQNGLSVFIPEEDEVFFVEPKVDVRDLNILGVEDERKISKNKIPYELNNVEVAFSAISFLQLANFTVSYKLEGLHDDWQHVQNPRTNKLQFNNLPPGDYQLKIKASLGGQFSSKIASSEPFSIIKPTYLQSWFIGAVILFLLMLGFGLNILITQFKEQGVLQKSIDEKNQEIKTAEDQFKNVWESSQDGFMLLNLKGDVLAVNPSMTKLAGVEEYRQFTGRHVKEFFKKPEYYYEHKDLIIRLISKSKSGSMEAFMPFHSGYKNIDLFVTKVNPEKKDDIVLMVFRDVTDKKIYEEGLKEAKERAEEANRIKTNFLSNMSHEIRTPLNGILGSTENIIFQNKDNHSLVGQLEIIMESGERLLNTINSILNMAKIEAHKMEVVYEETNINDFISHLLIPLKTLAMKKNLLLTARFTTKPFMAKVDRRYFEMIVNNIVGNAIKYSDEGLIKVMLKRVGDKIHLEVKDNGIGMSEGFIHKIYSPFEQESVGYARQFEGTGLGLSITKNLVDMLNGSIEIKSKKNEGTTVLVILPVN